jgi:hypothetical protein
MPAYLRAGAVFHPIFAKQFAVLIPLAAKPVQPPVAIKFLRRQLCVVMPGASAPMQFPPAKMFLHRAYAIAVKLPSHTYF